MQTNRPIFAGILLGLLITCTFFESSVVAQNKEIAIALVPVNTPGYYACDGSEYFKYLGVAQNNILFTYMEGQYRVNKGLTWDAPVQLGNEAKIFLDGPKGKVNKITLPSVEYKRFHECKEKLKPK